MIYLATPYNHPDPEVRRLRFHAACHVAAHFMKEGAFIFSPIAHTHPISVAGELPVGWHYWEAYDKAMLSNCSELWVVEMPGWDTSAGVSGEIKIAAELGLKIKFIKYNPESWGGDA